MEVDNQAYEDFNPSPSKSDSEDDDDTHFMNRVKANAYAS
jgi:hypothetical protein